MKVIMVMFDSLNRHMLPPYGCSWTHAPNFARLAQRAVTFDTSYVCSMPCMPARRDLHTGRPSLLHRSWGPLEPFDDSVVRALREAGVYTHLASDHYHYWECGGATYHTQYNSWEFFRGQEGDGWIGRVDSPPSPANTLNPPRAVDRYHAANSQYLDEEAKMPQACTMRAGMDFIRRNAASDNWFLQIETFDPHEPFHTQRQYKDRYAEHYAKYKGRHFDWPGYDFVKQTAEEVEHLRHQYAALLSMCDAYMGNVLDLMDELKLWDDTMLIVWTDHGFLLGEHNCWAKCWMPFYEEVAHTPFFVWDPRSGKRDERRSSLVQPAIDLAPTLLDFFGLQPSADMLGKNLRGVIAGDTPVRDAAFFGIHGGQINVTDGRYVYMRAAADDSSPIYNYTLMPTHMRHLFTPDELKEVTLAEPFGFTKGCRTMKVRCGPFWGKHPQCKQSLLYDLQTDPRQEHPLESLDIERRMTDHLVRLMRQCEAPPEQFTRMGLSAGAIPRA